MTYILILLLATAQIITALWIRREIGTVYRALDDVDYKYDLSRNGIKIRIDRLERRLEDLDRSDTLHKIL